MRGSVQPSLAFRARGGYRPPQVSSSRPIRLLLFLTLALGVQTTYVNPVVAAAEMRAMSCCAHHCDEPLSLPSARTCCQVTAVASGPAEGPVALSTAPLVTSAVVAAAGAFAPVLPAWLRTDLVRVAGSGPPTYLAQRHLLL